MFVGVKMLLSMNEYINAIGSWVGLDLQVPHIEISTPVSLAVIFGLLFLSMIMSVVISEAKKKGWIS
jgi:tellurite resistance protein TerC